MGEFAHPLARLWNTKDPGNFSLRPVVAEVFFLVSSWPRVLGGSGGTGFLGVKQARGVRVAVVAPVFSLLSRSVVCGWLWWPPTHWGDVSRGQVRWGTVKVIGTPPVGVDRAAGLVRTLTIGRLVHPRMRRVGPPSVWGQGLGWARG